MFIYNGLRKLLTCTENQTPSPSSTSSSPPPRQRDSFERNMPPYANPRNYLCVGIPSTGLGAFACITGYIKEDAELTKIGGTLFLSGITLCASGLFIKLNQTLRPTVACAQQFSKLAQLSMVGGLSTSVVLIWASKDPSQDTAIAVAVGAIGSLLSKTAGACVEYCYAQPTPNRPPQLPPRTPPSDESADNV